MEVRCVCVIVWACVLLHLQASDTIQYIINDPSTTDTPHCSSRPLGRVVVVKIGGSFLLSDGNPNTTVIREMTSTVRVMVGLGFRVVVVVGGGVVARQYIAAASALGANNGVKDTLGILVSRLNARLFIEAYGDGCYQVPVESLEGLAIALQVRNVVAMGGLQPGQSTTAVAALAAEYVNAQEVIFGTDVDGVYTADPRKDPTSKKLDHISYTHLRELCTGEHNTLPGQYRLMDGMALSVLQRQRIKATIIKGTQQNYLGVLMGEKVGTIVGVSE